MNNETSEWEREFVTFQGKIDPNKKYNVAFFSESNFDGITPRNEGHMRTDLAWMCALNAQHHPFRDASKLSENTYDVGIIIIPKQIQQFNIEIFNDIKKACKKVACMQEGPIWYFQDYTVQQQLDYIRYLLESDLILVHNEGDCDYMRAFLGLEGSDKIATMPSLMIEDYIKPCKPDEYLGYTILGGNMCKWYGGIDSYTVGLNIGTHMVAPTMGRAQEDENLLRLQHLKHNTWVFWMYDLSRFRYAVHLMPTHAAGTFNLNCAYWGIPCIGYDSVDTQRLLHPDLCISHRSELNKAIQLGKELARDEDFYNECSKKSKELYRKHYDEKVWLRKMNNLFKEIL
tara:strand:- start:341 stop:1369 length:1029 start_codon:yes stop_codon:yes gene_type:complete